MLTFLRLRRQITGRRFLKEFWGSFQVRFLFVFCVVAASLAAQDSSTSGGGGGNGGVTQGIAAASQFFDHDFVNVYGFANGVFNTNIPDGTQTVIQNGSPQVVEKYGNSFGWEAGGGITAQHTLRDGSLSLNYAGSYHNYNTPTFGAGQQQTISFGYIKRFNRHWTFGLNVAGGLLGFGTSYYSTNSIISETPGNPFSLESRFANVGLNLTYAQTRRLSYVFSGSFLYSGYKTPAATAASGIGTPPSTRGVTGGVSVLYRLTARTTVGGSYSHSYYHYTGRVGTTNVESGSLTLSHQFVDHWQLDLSAGINHSSSSGIAVTPISFVYQGTEYFGYYDLPYNRTINSPAFQGVLTHSYRHSTISMSGGQSVLAGNGFYLTSRDQFANGAFSFSTRKTNFGFGGNYARLSSVSTANLGETYSYYGVSASYGANFARYLNANARWDFLHYDSAFGRTASLNEQRVSFGISVSSKSVPLTLF